MLELLEELDAMSDKIALVTHRDDDQRKPSFALASPGQLIHLRFAGIPMGHEFSSLVPALLQVGGHPSKPAAAVIEQVKSLQGPYRFGGSEERRVGHECDSTCRSRWVPSLSKKINKKQKHY